MFRALSISAAAAVLGALSPYLGGALQVAGLGESDLFYWWFTALPLLALMLVDPSPLVALYVISMVYAMQYAAVLYAGHFVVIHARGR